MGLNLKKYWLDFALYITIYLKCSVTARAVRTGASNTITLMTMKKNTTESPSAGEPKKDTVIKKDLPVKNNMTSSKKNTASQTPGLNQAATTRDDLLPSDGDNLTN